MSKDPGYASSCGSNCACSTKKNDKSIHDVHIKALEVIDKELERLHATLRSGDGDDDITQEQISTLIEELTRLSEQLADAEVAE
jgi:hypothetical protein